MNCKPGELAVVISAPNDPEYLGAIIVCVSWMDGEHGGGWKTYPILRCKKYGFGLLWHDDDLRPIRDPGDDAVDEFLALTGKPDYKQKIAEKMKNEA